MKLRYEFLVLSRNTDVNIITYKSVGGSYQFRYRCSYRCICKVFYKYGYINSYNKFASKSSRIAATVSGALRIMFHDALSKAFHTLVYEFLLVRVSVRCHPLRRQNTTRRWIGFLPLVVLIGKYDHFGVGARSFEALLHNRRQWR